MSVSVQLLFIFSSRLLFIPPTIRVLSAVVCRLALCLGCLWRGYEDAQWTGVRDSAHEKLFKLLWDEVPEVNSIAFEGERVHRSCTYHIYVHTLCVVHACT